MTHVLIKSVSRIALTIATTATALTGCNKAADTNQQQTGPATGAPIAALPLATMTPPPTVYAPTVTALAAPAKPVRYAAATGSGRYRYIDQAYATNDAFGTTPPDYTVDYDGTRPWIWRADNGAYRVVEQVQGGERYYYYQPGADEPYYVTDPVYGYAYDGGALVGVYDSNGRAIEDTVARERAYDASRYYARANGLYRAAQTQQRQAAYARNWDMRRDAIFARQQQWRQAQRDDADWRTWHEQHAAHEQEQWQSENQHRLAYGAAIGLGGGAIAAALHGDHNDTGMQAERIRQQQTMADQQRSTQMQADQRQNQVRIEQAQRQQMLQNQAREQQAERAQSPSVQNEQRQQQHIARVDQASQIHQQAAAAGQQTQAEDRRHQQQQHAALQAAQVNQVRQERQDVAAERQQAQAENRQHQQQQHAALQAAQVNQMQLEHQHVADERQQAQAEGRQRQQQQHAALQAAQVNQIRQEHQQLAAERQQAQAEGRQRQQQQHAALQAVQANQVRQEHQQAAAARQQAQDRSHQQQQVAHFAGHGSQGH